MLSQTTYWGHFFGVTGHRYDPVSVVKLGFSCFFLHLLMAHLCCEWVFLCGSVVKGGHFCVSVVKGGYVCVPP